MPPHIIIFECLINGEISRVKFILFVVAIKFSSTRERWSRKYEGGWWSLLARLYAPTTSWVVKHTHRGRYRENALPSAALLAAAAPGRLPIAKPSFWTTVFLRRVPPPTQQTNQSPSPPPHPSAVHLLQQGKWGMHKMCRITRKNYQSKRGRERGRVRERFISQGGNLIVVKLVKIGW